jgi:hypothetical protein
VLAVVAEEIAAEREIEDVAELARHLEVLAMSTPNRSNS